MKHPLVTGSLALALAGSTLSLPAAAAVTMKFSEAGDQPQTIAVLNDEVAMTTGDGEVMIFNSQTQKLEIRNFSEGTYYILDPVVMEQRMKAAQGQMAEMQSQMAPMAAQMEQQLQEVLNDPSLSDDQKKMIEEQIRQMQASMGGAQSSAGGPARVPTYSTRPTGKNRTLSGISCTGYMVYVDERPDTELCIASHKSLGVSNQDYRTIRSMFAFMREMSRRMMAIMGQQGGGPDGASFPDVDGLPVESRDLNDGTVSRLESVANEVDESLFRRSANMRMVDPWAGG